MPGKSGRRITRIIRNTILILFLLAIVGAGCWCAANLGQAKTLAKQLLALPGRLNDRANEETNTALRKAQLEQLHAEIANQEQTDELILEELKSGGYTMDDPLIIVDPYNCSPLTALVIFQTETPSQVSVHIPGKTQAADVSFTFSDAKTDHMIPLYGLYANEENRIDLSVTDAENRTEAVTLSVETEGLPEFLDNVIIDAYCPDQSRYQPGFNFGYVDKYAYDVNGDVRWVNNTFNELYATLYEYGDGTYMQGFGSYYEGEVYFLEKNYLGKIIRVLYAPYGAHHDIEERDDGNILVTGSKDSEKTRSIEDFMYEIDVQTGEIVNTLDLKTVFPRSTKRSSDGAVDWFHQNTITWDAGDVIVSSRYLSAVARLSWPEGELKWILASHEDWPAKWRSYLLAPTGEVEIVWPGYQHKPLVLEDFDNDPDTVDILLLDNVSDVIEDEHKKGIYSRMVWYRINEKEKTIEQIWEYGKERGAELFAYRRGNAEMLENGNITGCFTIKHEFTDGNAADYLVTVEVDQRGELVSEFCLTGRDGSHQEYRSSRLFPYTEHDNSLPIGEATINLIPEEVLRKYEIE